MPRNAHEELQERFLGTNELAQLRGPEIRGVEIRVRAIGVRHVVFIAILPGAGGTFLDLRTKSVLHVLVEREHRRFRVNVLMEDLSTKFVENGPYFIMTTKRTHRK